MRSSAAADPKAFAEAMVCGMLDRRGFQPVRAVLDGELSDGMVWQAAGAA